MQSGVPFLVCDRPNAKPFELHIYAALAEEETRAISARTKAALAAATGKRHGSRQPHKSHEAGKRGAATTKAKAAQHAANVLPVIEKIRADGATTLAAIAAELNERRVKTAAGGSWHAATVARLLKAKAAICAAAGAGTQYAVQADDEDVAGEGAAAAGRVSGGSVMSTEHDKTRPTPPVEMITNQYGYTFLRREPDGPVEVWRERDDVLVMTATEFLWAFQWAYTIP